LGHHVGMDCRIADELIAMAAHDRKVCDELAASGALYEGYDPRMAAVHEKNALRLREIMAQIGWPTERVVGKRAAEAAWLIAQHAIAHPQFQRSCLEFLAMAAREQLVPAWQPAMLEDRIRVFEGRPQLYGTQLEPDEHGNMRPHTIEDPKGVDERRRAVSLEPLAEVLARTNRGRCQPTVNGSSTTIRSGSLRSVGAHVRNRRAVSRSATSYAVADLPIGARSGQPHHRATAKQ
jgi:hypothetical protein